MGAVMLLEVSDLFRFYHRGDTEIRALKGVGLMVAAGEIVALTGPSGSGKSTLLSCIAGLDEPDGGTVEVGGRRMTRRPEAEKAAIRSASLSFMAQRDNLFPHLTVSENLMVVLRRRGRADALRIAYALESVGLSARANAYPSTLSGGEKARAGLALALISDAPLLVADEPTAEVDGRTEKLILDLLVQRGKEGRGALVATHSPALEAVASRVLHLVDGRLTQLEPRRPPATVHLPGNVTGAPEELAPLRNEEVVVACEDVSRRFGSGAGAVDAVLATSLTIRTRDRISITGPSGCGKSTLVSMLAGLIAPSAGTISWFGCDRTEYLRPKRLTVVFQEPSLIPTLTVLENVHLPLLLLRAEQTGRAVMSAMEALDLLSLGELADKFPDELSGGQMQRVAFARALVTAPDVVLADEPTGQLDRPTGHALMSSVLAALEHSPTALVVTTHDAALASRMETRWHMSHGNLAA